MIIRSLRLARRPNGLPRDDDFELVEEESPRLARGEVLVENRYFSVDPYHREEMEEGHWALHGPMEGRTVGVVIESADPGLPPGTMVAHRRAYATHAVVGDARPLPQPLPVALSAYLGILGGTGLTAYVGLVPVGGLREGETVLITSAGGAVGTAAAHIARRLGAGRIIGVTGSDEKAQRLRDGPCDVVYNYRTQPVAELLAHEQVDLALEGVGGESLEATIGAMRDRGRIAWVGAISQYLHPDQPPAAPRNLYDIVGKELRVEGYLVRNYLHHRDAYEGFMTPLVAAGRVPLDETVAEGLESAIGALRSVLEGGNYGKQLVRLAPAPN